MHVDNYDDLFLPHEYEMPSKIKLKSLKHQTPISGLLPDAPMRRDPSGLAVFSSEQLEWGMPEDFGFHEPYIVYETEYTAHTPALNYADERCIGKQRPPHRYCRIERFKSVLGNMMNQHGHVPQKVIDYLRPFVAEMRLMEEKEIWKFCHTMLKKVPGWRVYYNRIPVILSTLQIIPFKVKDQTKIYQTVLEEFKAINNAWSRLTTDRKYFINFRYVCLRLLQRHGVAHPYEIPLLKTARKKVALDLIFEQLYDQVMVDELEAFLDSPQL